MSDEANNITGESTTGIKIDLSHKRKRINQIKTAIIITIIFLFLLPTVLCIILGIQFGKLQRQVDILLSTHSINIDDKEQSKNSGKYAFASTNELLDEEFMYTEATQDEESNVIVEDLDDNLDNIDIIDNSGVPGSTNQDSTYNNENIDNTVNIDDTENIDDKNNSDNSDNSENMGNKNNSDNTDNTENMGNKYNSDNSENTDYTQNNENIDNKNNTQNTENTENLEYIEDTDSLEDTKGIYNNKKVYLTFDDGPTNNTDLILDILADYNVKATFFVIGQEDDVSKERYKRIVDEGHILGMHSHSHKYNEIYKSIEDFDKDFTKLWKLLYDTTGCTPTLYRFPGGSLGLSGKKKMKDFISYLDDKGMTYYDWNVVNGDAEGINYTEEQMIENVLNGVAKKRTSIVLMHDGQGKNKTVATLSKILDALISGGAEVLPMDETVPLIQQIKATSVK